MAGEWREQGKALLLWLGRPVLGSVRDLTPIIAVIAAFQLLVFRQPLEDVGSLLLGLLLVVAGLSLFVIGLDLGLFPVGERMAHAFAKKGSVPWLLAFAFALGFGTVFAEPALIAVANKAAELAVEGAGAEVLAQRARHALVLRVTVALSAGTALLIGVVRILKGWPIHHLIIPGYAMIMLVTPFAPASIIAVAYDAGGVTTSTITVPLTAALGVGLASSIRGRSPLVDGFGLIAFVALMPILFVLLLGIWWA